MDVMEAIRRRRSVREYRDDPVPPETMDRVTEALRLAPSACNYQPWRFVLVADVETRVALAEACHEQTFVAEAPWIVVACALPETAYKRMGEYWSSAEVDVAIAVDHLTLAAAAEGLGTCWIGSFDEKAVKRLLRVPPEAKVVALTPLGYPRHPSLLRPVRPDERKPRSEVFSTDTW
jgi:nitroreductase